MCLQPSLIKSWDSWNWNGDEIIHSPIIPASRETPHKGTRYPIDIREFLTTEDNAVIRGRLGKIIERLSPEDQARFRSRSAGSFDFRADTILRDFRRLRYVLKKGKKGRCPDFWMFPDETLAEGGGDCEDLSFLLAALLMAAGISRYCIRVALGALHICQTDGKIQRHDHSWVMYQNESAVWEILEPTAATASRSGKQSAAAAHRLTSGVEYVPHYVFNADHLWQIHSRESVADVDFGDYCKSGEFWKKFDPDFAAGVHNTIFDQALGGNIPAAALGAVKRKSLCLDVNILTYDPRDHFDNGFIEMGWDQVESRLAAFQKDNNDWDSFGAAAHSIGDFYAHSSYLHFAALQNVGTNTGQAELFDPDTALAPSPQYGAVPADPSLPPFDLTSGSFSMNPYFWKGTEEQAAAQWSGKLISGRYAQKSDPQEGFFEHFTSIPRQLTQSPDFSTRGALPHHNEIAVDDQTMGSGHKLYSSNSSGPTDRRAYSNQFLWRKNSAIQHIQKALLDNYHPANP